MHCHKISERTGMLVAAKLVSDGTDILIITDKGQMMRTGIEGISVTGRSAQGVKIMNINREEGEHIVSIAKVSRDEDEPGEGEAVECEPAEGETGEGKPTEGEAKE